LALAVGGLFGLLQALERVGLNLYPDLPLVNNYYQGLTVHGVMLALVFTFAFSNGLLSLAVMRGLDRPLVSTALLQAMFWSSALGVALATWAILANEASVLFTFYPPLLAHPLFYLGLVLVVLSTWLASANHLLTMRAWQAEHPGRRVPLMAFTAVLTYVMWDLASVGVAIEVVVLLLPWSLGLVPTTDPQLARTLFWFTGHPIVYAWLLPAYVSWYTMIPAQVGGRVFSDPLVRLVFLLFLVLSIPIGLHHQYTEAGLSPLLKALHGLLTFAVFMPSVLTAFSVMATLEAAGRGRGASGLLGWIPRLPWSDPSVTAQLLAMVVFLLGGATGLINASYTVNLVVHNTAFIPGHFHLTVGTAVALTLMGICYWLIPYLTGQALFGRGLGLAQAWLWAIGVLIFSRGQIAGGLTSMPRRTQLGAAPYLELVPGWAFDNLLTAVGAVLMFVSALCFFTVIGGTLLGLAGREAGATIPAAAPEGQDRPIWPALDRWGLWLAGSIALILLSYGPVFIQLLPFNFTSPGFQPWR
jgi:cytochrome c oxidase subunit 1